MKSPLFITGTGLVTPLDCPGESTFEAMRAGRELVDRGIVVEERLGEVGGGGGGVDPLVDKSIRLGIVAAREAVERAGWNRSEGGVLGDQGTALFAGTSKGPILTALAAAERVQAGRGVDELVAWQVALGPAALGVFLAEALGLTGPVHTSVAACSSGLHALHAAARAIRCGDCERALVVAADTSAHPLFEGSFARLGVLAGVEADGHRHCRPFNPASGGFFLSEAAAAVTLERAKGNGTDDIMLEQTWIGADATHLLAVDPTTDSLRRGLALAADGRAVHFVHAHATGTGHDAYEMAAIRAMMERPPPSPAVFSHKRFLGHTLGAAGLVGVVISALCHRAGVTLEGTALARPARSITVSQGFGGHIALAVLRG